MDQPTTTTPIVCDMTTATDNGPERLLEYERLFAQALVGRERTAEGIRFRLRADDGVEAWVRDLAAREKACCAFFDFRITTDDERGSLGRDRRRRRHRPRHSRRVLRPAGQGCRRP